MHLLCSHHRNPIELVSLRSKEIVYPSCGSSFRVETDSTSTWNSTALG